MIIIDKNSNSLRSLSQIFTSSSFRKIIDKNEFSIVDDRISKHIYTNKDFKRIDILEYLYDLLQKNYKIEYLYKNTLINKLLLGKYSTNTTTAFNEFKIGFSIADFVLLNGEARVYEIKTEFDSLEKIDKQIADYQKFASKVFIVTNSKFVQTLTDKFINTSIGILELTNRNTIRIIKDAESNKDYFDYEILFKSLHKKEYCQLILDFYGFIPKVANTLIYRECLKMAKKIEIIEFQKNVIQLLKKRKLICPEILSSDIIPYQLKYICHTLNLNETQYHKLNNFLN